jgi:uncharacterized protein with HEPN domain
MAREPAAFLWDVQFAGRAVQSFVQGVAFERFASDLLLRSAVERQLQNMGEALAQLARLDPDLTNQVPEHRAVIGFRNVLVHGYAVLDQQVVWNVIQRDLPELLKAVDTTLSKFDPPPTS